MPNTSDNLIPMSERTEDEQRELAKKGGKASGKSRRRKRAMRENLEFWLDKKPIEQEVIDTLKQYGGERSYSAYLTLLLVQEAMTGNHKAILEILDRVGLSAKEDAKLDWEIGKFEILNGLTGSDSPPPNFVSPLLEALNASDDALFEKFTETNQSTKTEEQNHDEPN